MKNVSIWLLVVLAGMALAATSYRLVINGKPYSSTAIVVGGKTYVPVDALKAAGVGVSLAGGTLSLKLPSSQTAGGANQVSALEGCMGEWLFNGVWRMRVLEAALLTPDKGQGWGVKVELRNGSKSNFVAINNTGFQGLNLVFDDGSTQKAPYNINEFTDVVLTQGNGLTTTLLYLEDNPNTHKPSKLILVLKPTAFEGQYMRDSLGAAYSAGDPSFRVNLECRK